MPGPKVWPGQPYPLGATWDGKGVNFALFSAHAEKIELCLFDRSGHQEEARIVLPEYTDEVWHCYLPEARPEQLYGYRVGSPREDLAFDRRDSARHMPKCRVVESAFSWNHDRHPHTSWQESIIL